MNKPPPTPPVGKGRSDEGFQELDEDFLRELHHLETTGKLHAALALWIPLSIAAAIAFYFTWHLGDLHGRVEASKKCLTDMESVLPKGGASVLH